MPVYYPLIDDNEMIETKATFAEDTMTMVSVYNISTKSQSVDILGSYGTIPSLTWSFIFFSFLSFISLLHLGLKLSTGSGTKTDATWITTMAFLDQDNYPTKTLFISALSLFASIVMFFLMSYTTNSISSDLAVVKRAFAFKNYRDFLDKIQEDEKRTGKRSPRMAAFSTLLPEYEKFRDADQGTVESKLFKYRLLIEMDAKTFLTFATKVVTQETVVVGRELFVDGASYVMLSLLQEVHPHLRVLRVQESDPKKYTNVMAWRKGADDQFTKQIDIMYAFYIVVILTCPMLTIDSLIFNSISRMHVAGILHHVYWSAAEVVAMVFKEKLSPGDSRITIEVKEKISKRVEEVTPEMGAVALENLKLLLTLMMSMVALATHVLLFELLHNCISVRVLGRETLVVVTTTNGMRTAKRCKIIRKSLAKSK